MKQRATKDRPSASATTAPAQVRNSESPAPPSSSDRARDALLFAGICALAFALRYLYLHQARAVPLFGTLIMDGLSYGTWSDAIADGDWLGDQVFYQAPLYPYFLAVVKTALGRDLWTIRLVQIALGSLSCGVLFLAGRELFSRRAGVLAGLALAIYPSAIFFDGLIQKANLGLAWTVLLLWFVARALKAPSSWRWSGVGVALGLLMLTREETLLLVPLFAAWILCAPRVAPLRTRALRAAGWACGLALVLAPVALRNHAVGGELVLTTSQAGSNFYIGNNPNATGSYAPLRPGRSDTFYERKDAVELAEQESGRALTPAEVSRFWFAKSFAYIRDDPSAWLALLAKKLALTFNAYEIPDAEDMYYYERFSPLLRVLGTVFHYGVLVPLAFAGIVLTWHRRRELALLYGLIAVLCIGPVLFYVFARYRYPVVPPFLLFAGAALAEGWSLARARAYSLLALGGFVALAIALFVNRPMFAKEFQLPEAFNNAGVALARGGNDAAAIEEFQRSIALKPGVAETHGNLGVSLQRLQRLPEAIAAYRRALELKPGDARGELRLGSALALGGDAREAIALLERATQRAPTDPEAWSYFAAALTRDAQWRRARDAWERTYALTPDNASVAANFAWFLATNPDDDARDGARAVTIAEPLCARTGFRDLGALAALDAAYAETGRFADALKIAKEAQDLARVQRRLDVAAAIETRVALYTRGLPFRQGS